MQQKGCVAYGPTTFVRKSSVTCPAVRLCCAGLEDRVLSRRFPSWPLSRDSLFECDLCFHNRLFIYLFICTEAFNQRECFILGFLFLVNDHEFE